MERACSSFKSAWKVINIFYTKRTLIIIYICIYNMKLHIYSHILASHVVCMYIPHKLCGTWVCTHILYMTYYSRTIPQCPTSLSHLFLFANYPQSQYILFDYLSTRLNVVPCLGRFLSLHPTEVIKHK